MGTPRQRRKKLLIVSSQKFVADYTPPDYLLTDILRRRFVYSLTAYTGAGKTAVALYLSACVAMGKPLAGHEIDKGRVLYLAGENDEDVRMRWIAMSEAMGFDTNLIDVHFIPCRFPISENLVQLKDELEAIGNLDLVVVDTCAAYFEGDDDNHNVQMGDHARTLRQLTTLPGGPCALIPSHPTKGASNDNLIPRGGGAFLFEMDGNLVCQKNANIVDLHWQGKFRGADFEAIAFELVPLTSERLKDSKGRLAHTVMAKPLTGDAREKIETKGRKDEDALLLVMGPELRRINCQPVQDAWMADGKGRSAKGARASHNFLASSLPFAVSPHCP
jgi:hypothetical protein